MAWKAEVQVSGEGDKWYGNGLVFATYEEAAAYAKDLFNRWLSTVAWRVTETSDPVTHQIVDGQRVEVQKGE